MKTKSSTKIMLALAGSLLAIGSIQAQQTQEQRDSLLQLQRNAISLITPGEGKAAGASGFWGYAFGDYSYVSRGDSAGRGTKQWGKGLGESQQAGGTTANPNAFEIRRAYLGYDYKINDKFSAYALMAYEGDQDVNDNRTVYLKYFYVKWKNIWKGTDFKLGQQATNSFASAYNTEPLLGYRSIEKTILDMHGVDGSSDMGATLEGRIWTAPLPASGNVPSFIGYSAMIGDNSGNNPVPGFTGATTSLSGATITSTSTSVSTGGITTTTTTTTKQTINSFNLTTDNGKKFRGQLYFNCLNNALTIGVYADIINYGDVYHGTATGYLNQQMTQKAYFAYNQKWFGIGAEFFMQTLTNGEIESYANIKDVATGVTTAGAKNDTTTAEQEGYSIFAHGTIIQGTLNIFARYDLYTPDTKYSYTSVASGYTSSLANGATQGFASSFSNLSGNSWKETFVSVGLDWTPTKDKKVHLMPNIWYYGIKNGYGSGELAADSYLMYRVSFLFAFN